MAVPKKFSTTLTPVDVGGATPNDPSDVRLTPPYSLGASGVLSISRSETEDIFSGMHRRVNMPPLMSRIFSAGDISAEQKQELVDILLSLVDLKCYDLEIGTVRTAGFAESSWTCAATLSSDSHREARVRANAPTLADALRDLHQLMQLYVVSKAMAGQAK